MAYKNWSKSLLKKQLMHVAYVNNKDDYDILRQLLNKSIIPFDATCYTDNADKMMIEEYHYYIDFIKEMSKIPKLDLVGPFEMQIPTSSKLEFTHDFFKQVTPKWIDIFNKIYKERKRNLKFSADNNYSVYLESIDYSYININETNLIDDLFNLVHEYTHTIVDRICYRESYASHYPFIELPPMNMEFIAGIYLVDYFSEIEDDVNFYLGYIINLIIDYSKNIMLSVYDDRTLECSRSLDIEYNHSAVHDLSYVIPFVHMAEMFYLYLSDKEKWFDVLSKIITMDSSSNYLKEMKKLGLTPNKNLDILCDRFKTPK